MFSELVKVDPSLMVVDCNLNLLRKENEALSLNFNLLSYLQVSSLHIYDYNKFNAGIFLHVYMSGLQMRVFNISNHQLLTRR